MKSITVRFLSMLVLIVSVPCSSPSQNNNVLIEVGAATWCQWCPCADNILHQILDTYPDAMILQYHIQDPFSNYNGSNIYGLLSLSPFPATVIGRRTGAMVCYSGNCNYWSDLVTTQVTTVQPGVSIDLKKTYNSSTRVLQVTADVTSLREIDSACNISFVISENRIIYAQTGNTSCPGSQVWVHDWVARNMVNNAHGEQLNSGIWEQGVLITKSWSTTLSDGWVDNNCWANVFVYRQSDLLNSHSYVQQTKKQSVTAPSGVINNNGIPFQYSLSQNYPNPFNSTTNIKFTIPEESNVSLKVYSMTGSLVQTFVDGNINTGTYNAELDGTNLSSGIYFYTLIAHPEHGVNYIVTKKMILSK